MKYFLALLLCFFNLLRSEGQDKAVIYAERQVWLSYLDKVARPVLKNLAEDKLKENMPVELSPGIDNAQNRIAVSYLEAFARTFSGIAPWLNLEGGSENEIQLRDQYRQWALKAIANAVNPAAKDYLKWDGGQPLVDASFFALGLIRCPWVWQHLDTIVKQQVADAFIKTRMTIPAYNNWLLFSGMIEAFFCNYNLPYDPVRIDYGIKEFSQHWYTGDGMFADGMNFHLDYYNSYVIQPYLQVILEVIGKKDNRYNTFKIEFDKISKRYAEIQERLINTDGSFPVIGRSIVYRGGAFQHLANMALINKLPVSLSPAQVRGALTAVIKKTLDAPSTFNESGWLNIGLCGHQPGLADTYITRGSLYLCSEIFLPLGLSETDAFWSSPSEPWTSVKIWNGGDVPADHALDIHR
ncbi:MAG: DUF2264 domain-containing protein [Bacteroidetes bacterium]|nr:DUF2264 domain-containing protein [Bacteroidota bacterium]